ncbi:MAG: S8 family serine peptidase, partial [Pseudomonadota bacterium]
SWTSDQIAGLEQVLTWVNSGVNVASVNMSLGGGRHYSHCDFDSRKAIIDNLKAAGVATVIASGNNGFGDSVGAPSCISTAVTVGSTTKSDVVSSFSNHDQIVDLLAPGSSIRAASAGGAKNALTFKSGTSMATPHVAGAFALLKGAVPQATPDEIERALKCTGVQLTDNNTPKPRISMRDAHNFLVKPDTSKSFGFNSAKQVDKWDHALGNWTFGSKDMRVVADQSSGWYVSVAPFCANDKTVTADITRAEPDPSADWDSGLLMNSTVSSNGTISGLAFMYRVSASNVTTGAIYQIDALNGVTDSGSTSLLCDRDFTGKALGETRRLTAEKQGNSVEFKIDGITVCSAQTDARFTDGHAGVIWEAPENDTSHSLIVDTVRLQALTQSSTITAGSGF